MSGHSKWHSIRRSKGVLDQRRGQLFTKLARNITIAAREGLPDPDLNFRLRLAVDKAKEANMPSENIQRAIDRANAGGGEALEEIYYEGYAPGGVAMIIEAATDNRNRTASDVRSTITKAGGNPGEPGSVAWMFEQRGLITISLEGKKLDVDEVQLLAIDAGADDVQVSDDAIEVYTEFTQLAVVRDKLRELGLPISSAEKTLEPKATVQPDEKEALQALRLVEKLEDLDDVQKVYTNIDLTDELMAKLEG
jgi:YebC/PmpR family DNA-binding regulatory protein